MTDVLDHEAAEIRAGELAQKIGDLLEGEPTAIAWLAVGRAIGAGIHGSGKGAGTADQLFRFLRIFADLEFQACQEAEQAEQAGGAVQS